MNSERSISSDHIVRPARAAPGAGSVNADRLSVLFFSTAVTPSWEQSENQRLAARLFQSEKWRFEAISFESRGAMRGRGRCYPAGLKAAAALSRRLRRMIPRYRGLHVVACPFSPLVLQLTLPLVLGRFYGVPAIVDLRFGVTEEAVLSPGRSTRKILSLAHAILVGSESPAVRLARLGLPATVASLVVDGERFRARAIETVQPRILARLPASGPDDAGRASLKVLLKAFELVKHKYPRTELRVLCDWGSPSAELSDDHGSGVRIEVAAHDDQVIRAYEWADVYVNPAILSTSLMALAHALACGLPVVSTRGGGAAELIRTEDAGFLVRAGQPGELADRIIDLVEKPDLARRMSLSSAHRGKALQGKAPTDNWLRLYRRVLSI